MASEVRITGPLLKVLYEFLLQPDASLSGSDISRRTDLRSGTLYPLLNRLEEAGWLTSNWEEITPQEVGRPRRRLYEMTGAGARQARAACREVPNFSGVSQWSL